MRVWTFGFLVMVAGAGCASAGGASDIETVSRVPTYVLTVDDLVQRVRRSQADPLVQTQGIRVVGTLVKRGQGCDLDASPQQQPIARASTNPPQAQQPKATPFECKAADAAFIFADPDGSGRGMAVLLSDADASIVEGERYVLGGSVEVAPDIPQRWVLRGTVLARVK